MPINSLDNPITQRPQGPVRLNHFHVGEEAGGGHAEGRRKFSPPLGLLKLSPYRGGSRRCLAVPFDVPTTLTAPKERSYIGLSRLPPVFIVARRAPENRRKKPLSDYPLKTLGSV